MVLGVVVWVIITSVVEVILPGTVIGSWATAGGDGGRDLTGLDFMDDGDSGFDFMDVGLLVIEVFIVSSDEGSRVCVLYELGKLKTEKGVSGGV